MHIVPIDPELLDQLINLAEGHVSRLEAQRTTQAKHRRKIVEYAKELLQEYTVPS